MPLRMRAIAVKQLPEKLSIKQRRIFFSELVNCMNVDGPRIVFDCSEMRQMDRSAIHLLLCCLEEAMKRNGDIKLAAISSEVAAILGHSGVDRLFEIFETNADAVDSFRRLPLGAASRVTAPGNSRESSENAA